MKSKLLTLLSTFLLTAILPAQEGEKVTLRIDFVAWGDAIEGLSLGSARDGKFNALPFTYSEPIKYSGPAVLRLHHDGAQAPIADAPNPTPEDDDHTSKPLAPGKPAEEGKTHAIPPELAKLREEDPSIVALIPLPGNSSRVTVLLAPAADGTFQPYVIDDDPAKLPPGKLRIHNLSPFPIAMQFADGTRAEIKSGHTALANSRNGQAAYRLAYQLDGEWTIQENNIIGVPKDEQTQFIVLKSNNSYFLSSDGATGGFLQSVVLRRLPEKEG